MGTDSHRGYICSLSEPCFPLQVSMSPPSSLMATNILFGIVSRISEYSWKQTPLNPITTCKHNSVLIRLEEFIVKNFLPLGMEKLPVAMRIRGVARWSASGMLQNEVFEVVWQLANTSTPADRTSLKFTHRLEISCMRTKVGGWLASFVLRFVAEVYI